MQRFCNRFALCSQRMSFAQMRKASAAAAAFGVKDSDEAVFSAADMPSNLAAKASREVLNDLTWARIDAVGRCRLTPLANTATNEVMSTLRADIASNKVKPVAVNGVAKDAMKQAADVKTMIQIFEAAMVPVRKLELERYDIQLEIYTLRDHLNLGLTVFKQEQIDKKTTQLKEAVVRLAKNRQQHQEYVAKNFSTEMFNDLVNVLRIASEQHPNCHSMAVKVLEDMGLCKVTFDDATKMLVRNVVLGDGPHENSGLLFAHVEGPERGEISLQEGPIEAVADEALKTIAKRHATPLDADEVTYVKLRSGETHPNLQRSSE